MAIARLACALLLACAVAALRPNTQLHAGEPWPVVEAESLLEVDVARTVICGNTTVCPDHLPQGGVCCADNMHCCAEKCVMVARQGAFVPECRFKDGREAARLQSMNNLREKYLMDAVNELESDAARTLLRRKLEDVRSMMEQMGKSDLEIDTTLAAIRKMSARELAKGPTFDGPLGGKQGLWQAQLQAVARAGLTGDVAKELQALQSGIVPQKPLETLTVAQLQQQAAAGGAQAGAIAAQPGAVAPQPGVVSQGPLPGALAGIIAVQPGVSAPVQQPVINGAPVTGNGAQVPGAAPAATNAAPAAQQTAANATATLPTAANVTSAPNATSAINGTNTTLPVAAAKKGASPAPATPNSTDEPEPSEALDDKPDPKEADLDAKLQKEISDAIEDTRVQGLDGGAASGASGAGASPSGNATRDTKAVGDLKKGIELELSAGFKTKHHNPLRVQRWRDVCLLSGHVSANEGLVTRLPKACLPQGQANKSRIIFTALEVIDGRNMPVRVDITGTGEVWQTTTHAMDADYSAWTSWDGIIFTVHQDKPIELGNGWESSAKIDSNRDTREPVYSTIRSEVSNSTVCVASGKMESRTKAGSPIAAVAKCSPEGNLILLGNRNGKPVSIALNSPNGTLNIVSPAAVKINGPKAGKKPNSTNATTAVGGVPAQKTEWVSTTFAWVQGAGRNITTASGWRPLDGFRGPAISLVENFVFISGAVERLAGIADYKTILKLPRSAHPMKHCSFATARVEGDGIERIDVKEDGTVTYRGNATKLSLSGIVFAAKPQDGNNTTKPVEKKTKNVEPLRDAPRMQSVYPPRPRSKLEAFIASIEENEQ